VSQSDIPPEVKRFAVLTDIIIKSDQPGEIAAARAKLRAGWLRGSDFVEAIIERDRLFAVVAQYTARLDQLEAENQRLSDRNKQAALPDALGARLWVDANLPPSPANRHAQWVLSLVAQGLVHRTDKELDFLRSCARRRGALSDAQQDWLSDILRDVAARTGQAPPP
jgi:hypothetical protein